MPEYDHGAHWMCSFLLLLQTCIQSRNRKWHQLDHVLHLLDAGTVVLTGLVSLLQIGDCYVAVAGLPEPRKVCCYPCAVLVFLFVAATCSLALQIQS